MLEDLRNEMHNFLNDMDKNIKNEEDLLYIKQRTAQLLDVVLDNIEQIASYKEDKLNALIRKQEQGDQKIQELKEKIDDMYEEMYEEEESDFSVSCPYCNCEFDADIDDEISEIRCPECGNIIELDWNGNPDDDSGCNGGCSHCGGCN